VGNLYRLRDAGSIGTHNFAGGTFWTLDELGAVCADARTNGLAIHMDGARLFNACVALAVLAAAYAAQVDSVWIDFTKGLGAPIGAVGRTFVFERPAQAENGLSRIGPRNPCEERVVLRSSLVLAGTIARINDCI
jgi:hypothetical protein